MEMAQRCEDFEFCTSDSAVHDGFVMHTVSSIAHTIASDRRLMCGRTVGSSFCGFPKNLVLSPFCGHCEKWKLERLMVPGPTRSPLQDESSWQLRSGAADSSQQDESSWMLAIRQGA